ncbi:hypothetical protein PENPOL_c014G05700 [Penicillium polonicum]|uniref:Uncharacterized protein n=1 Tax=Penicillium polonicum TaxID=60169 RepID=A0A1V6NB16_PENPO|nr:hypothetical protein PENPOL_c014G05700 [Penicillium polonicum]
MCPTRAPEPIEPPPPYETTFPIDISQGKMTDPGPSVRTRTATELTAILREQIEDTSFPGLDINGLPLMRNFLTSLDNKFRDLHPERTELDWKNGTRKPVKSPAARRAAQGQLYGVEAPANQECTSCAEGKKNTFDHCRIVFTKEQAGPVDVGMCQLRLCGSRPQMLFRPDRFLHVPSWVVTAVSEREPSSPTLYVHYPTMYADATQTSLIRGNPVLNMTPASSKDAAEENPPKCRNLKVGPANPIDFAISTD